MQNQETGSLAPTLPGSAGEFSLSMNPQGVSLRPPKSTSNGTSVDQTVAPPSFAPSECSCGCESTGPPQLVFALGRLGYDFGIEARRDSHCRARKRPSDSRGTDPVRPRAAVLVKAIRTSAVAISADGRYVVYTQAEPAGDAVPPVRRPWRLMRRRSTPAWGASSGLRILSVSISTTSTPRCWIPRRTRRRRRRRWCRPRRRRAPRDRAGR